IMTTPNLSTYSSGIQPSVRSYTDALRYLIFTYQVIFRKVLGYRFYFCSEKRQTTLGKRQNSLSRDTLLACMTIEKDAHFLNNKGKRILVAGLAFLALYLVSYILDPFAEYWVHYFEREPLLILGDWLTSFI